MKNFLIGAAVINFMHALLNIVNGVGVGHLIFTIFLIIAGIIYLYSASDEKFALEQRKFIIASAIINLFINFIPGLLALISLESKKDLKKEIKVREKIDPETKRIDILLKLGVGMVILAGLLFATTSWNEVSDFFKFVFLLIMSGIFGILYYITNTKLKIKTSAFIYFILTNLFLIFSFLSIGYFGLIGPWFSIDGEGSKIFYASLSLFTSVIIYFINSKINKEELKLVPYFLLSLSGGLIMSHFKLGIEYILVVFALIGSLINYLNLNKGSSLFSKILIYIVSILSIYYVMDYTNQYLPLILGLVLVFNLFRFNYNENDKMIDTFNAILIIVLPVVSIFNLNIDMDFKCVLLAGVYSVIYILSLNIYSDSKKEYYLSNLAVLYNIGMFALFLNTTQNEYFVPSVFISSFLVISNLVYRVISKETNIKLFEHNLLAYKVLLLVLGVFRLDYFNIEPSWINPFASLAMLLIYISFREFKEKAHFFYSFLIILLISTLSVSILDQYVMLLILALSFAPYLISNVEYEKLKIPTFIYLLLTLFAIINQLTFFNLEATEKALIVLIVYSVIGVLVKNDNKLVNIVKFVAVLPIYRFTYYLNVDLEIKNIIRTLYYLYLVYVIGNNIIKDEDKKDKVASILVSLIVISIMFTGSWLTGLFVGLIGLVSIVIGYLVKTYKSLFTVGIAITIINIIYRLRNLLTEIPMWLYLLIGGLLMIGFVTYKEINKKDK